MPLHFDRARPLLQSGDFARLFRQELGWEPDSQKVTLRVDDRDFTLNAFAGKRGFTAWLCECVDGRLPLHATRLKIDRALTETSFEHLVVFATPARDRQSWMWVRREAGKPVAPRTHEYFREQPGDSLLQKLDALFISFEDEEAGITISEVAGRARAAFDVERVTKQFYRDFDLQRKAFVKFIAGIEVVADREWYASVMLNRLMFVYFIQRKGFLDNDRDYLRQRLARCQAEKGRDKFYSFYRYFLLRLFHEGFGRRRADRSADFEKLLGRIPYLNGGLFDVHELERPERYGKDIEIPDKAFEAIFAYFDRYQWHLDERPLRADNEINPDVLGYIFEKYINQKQMGAYYTKEDITDYIGKNTILPFLLDAARAKCKVAFEGSAGFQPAVWNLLRENPDRYIYEPVRRGTERPLPPDIEKGVDPAKPGLLERRAGWNRPAAAEFALPTEIWREVVARRQRCAELRRKLAAGEVREVADLITLNLDIRQFTQDLIAQCEGPDLLRAFWHALEKVTVLDPTCGSGAFLFAALNLLEPLYEACLDRMEAFVGDLERSSEKHRPEKFADFRAVLQRVADHPNRRYFIFKSIILQNLYGVDIMEEAVEICKLRLFLKLAAQVSPDATKDNLGIEPLPDIDFNVRAGNTLVGYATAEEVRRSMTTETSKGADQLRLLDDEALSAFDRFHARCADVDDAFAKFRERQTEGDGSVPAAHKQELQKRLSALRDELNRYLATDYGVKTKDKAAFEKWATSHQPFHWFVEFYGILKAGGFDVIIGNPPWKEYSAARKFYTVRGYTTESSGNLYALCTERSVAMLSQRGFLSFIVQLPIVCSSRMDTAREFLARNASNLMVITCDDRPGKLFDGMQHCRSTIFTMQRGSGSSGMGLWTSGYRRWATSARDTLFPMVTFSQVGDGPIRQAQFPKLASSLQVSVFNKLFSPANRALGFSVSSRVTTDFIFYQESAQYWVKATIGLPHYAKNGRVAAPAHGRYLYFKDTRTSRAGCAILNSSLFYAYFLAYGDCFHVSDSLATSFSVPPAAFEDRDLESLGAKLMRDLERNAQKKSITTKDGDRISYDEFRVGESKAILDKIDTVLATHFGFTPEELDFIINYDIKYRMGRGDEDDE